jgi:hypothetical protein
MREDIYGPKLWAIIQQATEPVTAGELIKGAGCSRARVYQWLAQVKDQGVHEVGRNTRGSALFVYRPADRRRRSATGNRAPVNEVETTGTPATATTTLSIDADHLQLGMTLVLTGMRLSTDGGYVLELSGDEGVCIAVRPTAVPAVSV